VEQTTLGGRYPPAHRTACRAQGQDVGKRPATTTLAALDWLRY
jgi:hypothetical protein